MCRGRDQAGIVAGITPPKSRHLHFSSSGFRRVEREGGFGSKRVAPRRGRLEGGGDRWVKKLEGAHSIVTLILPKFTFSVVQDRVVITLNVIQH